MRIKVSNKGGIIMEIREVVEKDLVSLLELYTQLHDNTLPEITQEITQLWKQILTDKNHHIICGIVDNKIVCSCVLIIIPNLTHHQRPYALIENVITHKDYRNKGFATAILNYAGTLAKKENCYKIMLMTGSKLDSTLKFYENAGYNRIDKTAFIKWLE